GDLPENLGIGMERVAGLTPSRVRKRGPLRHSAIEAHSRARPSPTVVGSRLQNQTEDHPRLRAEGQNSAYDPCVFHALAPVLKTGAAALLFLLSFVYICSRASNFVAVGLVGDIALALFLLCWTLLTFGAIFNFTDAAGCPASRMA